MRERTLDAGWRAATSPGHGRAIAGPVDIVGGGAAGNAAAETLRQEGHSGRVVLASADSSPPYDRPNLSKDYLAGTAQADWLPLRAPEFYADQAIELHIETPVAAIDTRNRTVSFGEGEEVAYGALLLATAPSRSGWKRPARTCRTRACCAPWPTVMR